MQKHVLTADEVAVACDCSNTALVELRIKVVPGSSRDRIAGMLGDRLKVAVAAPPEGGKANKAVCKLLASALNLPARSVTVTAGATQPLKTVGVAGLSRADLIDRICNA